MEQDAENDYGSDGEENEGAAEAKFSSDQLGRDRERLTQRMSQNRKTMQYQVQMIEALSNKLQQAIIKTCSNKQMLKQVDIKYLTVYIRDTAAVQERLDEWQAAVDQEAEQAEELVRKYQVVWDEQLPGSNSKVLVNNFSLQPSAQVKFNSIGLAPNAIGAAARRQAQHLQAHNGAEAGNARSRASTMKDAASESKSVADACSLSSKDAAVAEGASILDKLRQLVQVYQNHYHNQKQMLQSSQEMIV